MGAVEETTAATSTAATSTADRLRTPARAQESAHGEPSRTPVALEEPTWAVAGFALGWTAVAVLAFSNQLRPAAAIASVVAIRNGLMEVLREEPYARYGAPKQSWELRARGGKVRARMWGVGAAVYGLAALFNADRAGAVAVAVLLVSVGAACVTLAFDVRRTPEGIPRDRWLGDPVLLWIVGALLILIAMNSLAWTYRT